MILAIARQTAVQMAKKNEVEPLRCSDQARDKLVRLSKNQRFVLANRHAKNPVLIGEKMYNVVCVCMCVCVCVCVYFILFYFIL